MISLYTILEVKKKDAEVELLTLKKTFEHKWFKPRCYYEKISELEGTIKTYQEIMLIIKSN